MDKQMQSNINIGLKILNMAMAYGVPVVERWLREKRDKEGKTVLTMQDLEDLELEITTKEDFERGS
jgi:hypothetical protein